MVAVGSLLVSARPWHEKRHLASGSNPRLHPKMSAGNVSVRSLSHNAQQVPRLSHIGRERTGQVRDKRKTDLHIP